MYNKKIIFFFLLYYFQIIEHTIKFLSFPDLQSFRLVCYQAMELSNKTFFSQGCINLNKNTDLDTLTDLEIDIVDQKLPVKTLKISDLDVCHLNPKQHDDFYYFLINIPFENLEINSSPFNEKILFKIMNNMHNVKSLKLINYHVCDYMVLLKRNLVKLTSFEHSPYGMVCEDIKKIKLSPFEFKANQISNIKKIELYPFEILENFFMDARILSLFHVVAKSLDELILNDVKFVNFLNSVLDWFENLNFKFKRLTLTVSVIKYSYHLQDIILHLTGIKDGIPFYNNLEYCMIKHKDPVSFSKKIKLDLEKMTKLKVRIIF